MSVLASRVRKLLSVTFDHCFFFCAGPEAPTSCDELECSFGATCIEVSGQAHCECPPPDCDERNKTKVGASNSRLPERLYHSDVSIRPSIRPFIHLLFFFLRPRSRCAARMV